MSARVKVTNFLQQRGEAKSAGIAIIRNILKTNEFPNGVTTKELYNLAIAQPAPPGFNPYPLGRPTVRPQTSNKKHSAKVIVKDSYPPNPDHPIRSIAFLKKDILAALSGLKEIKTVKQKRTNPPPPEELAALQNPKTKRARKALSTATDEFVWVVVKHKAPLDIKEKEVVGREVGVGADISHLNPRRQRARVGKVTRAVIKMKDLQDRFREKASQSNSQRQTSKS